MALVGPPHVISKVLLPKGLDVGQDAAPVHHELAHALHCAHQVRPGQTWRRQAQQLIQGHGAAGMGSGPLSFLGS